MERFSWWLEHEAVIPATLGSLSSATIRSFLAYAREPHPEGRYGSNRPSARREARPATVNAYFRALRACVNFCLAEGLLEEIPLRNVKPPRVPMDQIQPLSPDQVQALVDAARRTRAPERNVALILLMVDSVMRVSEVGRLHVGDVDHGMGELMITVKGNRKR